MWYPPDFLPITHLPHILGDVIRWALSRKNTASSHEQISPLHNFIMIHDSIIHTSAGRTPVAAWPLGNTFVGTWQAALAGITDISLELQSREGQWPPYVATRGISCVSSIWMLLGGKDSMQKWHCHAFSRICALPHFMARRNIVQSFPCVLSPGMVWVE